MPPAIENSDRPKPSRIVVNFERAREMAHIPQRGSRGFKILGIIAIALVVVVLAAALGGYLWWRSYKTKPAYSLALLVEAVERNDMAAFDRIVDTDKVVESFVPQVTEKAVGRYASALTGPLRSQVESLIPTLMPVVKEKVREEIIAHVKELSERASGKPFFIVALGVPYVVDIKEENGAAKVTANFKDRPVLLTMQPNGDRWKIVSVTDETLAARIVDNIAKDLPAVGSQVEKEVRKKLQKNLPGGLPDIPLLNDNK
ncbi:MAG: DUF2939 domain-containing protein [Pyrinomonadaceae bacterium]|nr:DUF2939 domain-containing protein [Pyrinomonadaceae bacterium]